MGEGATFHSHQSLSLEEMKQGTLPWQTDCPCTESEKRDCGDSPMKNSRALGLSSVSRDPCRLLWRSHISHVGWETLNWADLQLPSREKPQKKRKRRHSDTHAHTLCHTVCFGCWGDVLWEGEYWKLSFQDLGKVINKVKGYCIMVTLGRFQDSKTNGPLQGAGGDCFPFFFKQFLKFIFTSPGSSAALYCGEAESPAPSEDWGRSQEKAGRESSGFAGTWSRLANLSQRHVSRWRHWCEANQPVVYVGHTRRGWSLCKHGRAHFIEDNPFLTRAWALQFIEILLAMLGWCWASNISCSLF